MSFLRPIDTLLSLEKLISIFMYLAVNFVTFQFSILGRFFVLYKYGWYSSLSILYVLKMLKFSF